MLLVLVNGQVFLLHLKIISFDLVPLLNNNGKVD